MMFVPEVKLERSVSFIQPAFPAGLFMIAFWQSPGESQQKPQQTASEQYE
jgi:hypothetical protein